MTAARDVVRKNLGPVELHELFLDSLFEEQQQRLLWSANVSPKNLASGGRSNKDEDVVLAMEQSKSSSDPALSKSGNHHHPSTSSRARITSCLGQLSCRRRRRDTAASTTHNNGDAADATDMSIRSPSQSSSWVDFGATVSSLFPSQQEQQQQQQSSPSNRRVPPNAPPNETTLPTTATTSNAAAIAGVSNSLAESQKRVPSPDAFVHELCQLQRDDDSKHAKGREATLAKLRQKVNLLCETALSKKSSSKTVLATSTSSDSKKKKSGKVQMKRVPAVELMTLDHKNPNVVETRSLLELRMGPWRLKYGIMLQWDISTHSHGSVSLHHGTSTANRLTRSSAAATTQTPHYTGPVVTTVLLKKNCSKSTFLKTTVSKTSNMTSPLSSSTNAQQPNHEMGIGSTSFASASSSFAEPPPFVLQPPYCIQRPAKFPAPTLAVGVCNVQLLHSGDQTKQPQSSPLSSHSNGKKEKHGRTSPHSQSTLLHNAQQQQGLYVCIKLGPETHRTEVVTPMPTTTTTSTTTQDEEEEEDDEMVMGVMHSFNETAHVFATAPSSPSFVNTDRIQVELWMQPQPSMVQTSTLYSRIRSGILMSTSSDSTSTATSPLSSAPLALSESFSSITHSKKTYLFAKTTVPLTGIPICADTDPDLDLTMPCYPVVVSTTTTNMPWKDKKGGDPSSSRRPCCARIRLSLRYENPEQSWRTRELKERRRRKLSKKTGKPSLWKSLSMMGDDDDTNTTPYYSPEMQLFVQTISQEGGTCDSPFNIHHNPGSPTEESCTIC